LVDSGKWNCERCKWKRLCLLEEKLRNVLNKIEDLKLKYKKLEELPVAATGNEIGRQNTMQEHEENNAYLWVTGFKEMWEQVKM
jgi:hypothetical protein